MVRFSCFQAHILSHRQKRSVRLSTEAMQKTLEDTSESRAPKIYSSSAAENKSHLRREGDTFNCKADHASDSSPTERDCRSEEIESKYNTDCDIAAHKNPQIKKSISLGSGLNWKERASGTDDSEDEMEQKLSYCVSADRSGISVADGTNNNNQGFSLLPDQFQEHAPSDSVHVNYNFAKDESIFSIGESQLLEQKQADKDDIHLSGASDSGDRTPRIPHVIGKSSSLPSLGSPNRLSASFFPCSRSFEDLNALDSRTKGTMHEFVRQSQDEGQDYNFINDKNIGENTVNDTYEPCNYADSAKDWIIPASDGVNMVKTLKGETSVHHWDEIPSKDFKLKRIEEWVSDLQYCSPLEQADAAASVDDYDIPKNDDLQVEDTTAKLEVKVNPGMDTAKRYISALNPSATAAQLTNLGLAVIPFLSVFGNLKALNLSGNAIVRIAAGALPRGLHILNLSKNSISTIEGLRDLTRLRVLDLSYNRILRIGHGLAGCSSIKELYLAGNKISEVEGLHRLLKLTVLDLRFNKISTTKCLGQLASNYNCLQALSLEGNPAQKNVGDEQLKKCVMSLLPHLSYYNRQSIKVGTVKDTADRSARLGISAHQTRAEVKSTRKGTHGIVAQKVSSSSVHSRKSQVVSSQRLSRNKNGHARLPPSGIKTSTQARQLVDFSNKVLGFGNSFSMHRSRSEGTLGAL